MPSLHPLVGIISGPARSLPYTKKGCDIMDYTCLDALPDVLRVEEVAKVLRISRSSAYSLAHSQNFPVINPLGGKSMRIPKGAFIKWLESHTQY